MPKLQIDRELQFDDRVSWKTNYCPQLFGHVLSTHGLIVNVRSDSGLRLTLPSCLVTVVTADND